MRTNSLAFVLLRSLIWIVVIGGLVLLFGWDHIVGLPRWLKAIGFLEWLNGLSPIDKWVSAVGAVLIGSYAIFHETLLAWLRRPKLIVRFDLRPPYVIAMPLRIRRQVYVNGQGGEVLMTCPSYQVRMVVRNAGVNRAESVEVYAVSLFRKVAESYEPVQWFLPMNLIWANDEKALAGISSAVERTVNVIGLQKPGNTNDPETVIPQTPQGFDYKTTCLVRLHTAITTTSYSNHVYPGEYRLKLIVAAANAASVWVTIDFRFSGKWSDDTRQMFQDEFQLRVRAPESVS